MASYCTLRPCSNRLLLPLTPGFGIHQRFVHSDSESFNGGKGKQEKLKTLHDRVIRVDHAGEFGANRIYAGQMAVLGKFQFHY